MKYLKIAIVTLYLRSVEEMQEFFAQVTDVEAASKKKNSKRGEVRNWLFRHAGSTVQHGSRARKLG